MRDIRFRAYDSANAKMIDWEFIKAHLIMPGHSSWEWMQYTDLKDKNGKEIYEGDVLSFRGQDILKVCWDKHHVCWLGEYITNTSTMRDLFAFEWDKAEVIGNIYENPELLEAK